jgi:hypothetical protein
VQTLPLMSKPAVAEQIIDRLVAMLAPDFSIDAVGENC